MAAPLEGGHFSISGPSIPRTAARNAQASGPSFNKDSPVETIGTKRTFQLAPSMSAFGGKADITRTCGNVCF